MLTSTKVGKALGLTKATICTLARSGRIPYIELPSGHRRFDLNAVRASLSTDALASTFLYPITGDIDGERKRILFLEWRAKRREIEKNPLPKFDYTNFYEHSAKYKEAADKHAEALGKIDDEFEKATGCTWPIVFPREKVLK
jgi:hypothetical protein